MRLIVSQARLLLQFLKRGCCYSYSSKAVVTFFQARLKDVFKNMAEEKKIHRGGHCLRYEPEDMKAIIEDQAVMEVFRRVGCLRFCEKL